MASEVTRQCWSEVFDLVRMMDVLRRAAGWTQASSGSPMAPVPAPARALPGALPAYLRPHPVPDAAMQSLLRDIL